MCKPQTVYNELRYSAATWKVVQIIYEDIVVVHDSLGLAAELERRMSHVVGTYQDEWRTAVETQKYVNARDFHQCQS